MALPVTNRKTLKNIFCTWGAHLVLKWKFVQKYVSLVSFHLYLKQLQFPRTTKGVQRSPKSDWFIIVHVIMMAKPKQEVVQSEKWQRECHFKMWLILAQFWIYMNNYSSGFFPLWTDLPCGTFSSCFAELHSWATAKMLSFASFTSRRILCIRHYCKKTPTKLRVSEAISGSNLGANIKIQVRMTCLWLFLLGLFYFLQITLDIKWARGHAIQLIASLLAIQ